ncbi:alpha-ketoglutarate-dependent dioxygenase AlkB family protein [Luteimonas vadosa]
MGLFDASPWQVIDDAEGGVRYWPGFAALRDVDQWFAALLANAGWEAHRRQMYDRVVDVPRLTATYRVDQLPDDLPLAGMLAQVQAIIPAPFNSVGLNLYRDGRDSVAMHNDKLHHLAPGQPIALVSLGASRRMLLRPKRDPRDPGAARANAIRIELEHGSLLAMSHASQRTHEHGIPKTAGCAEPRMSVVFRVRPAPR